jgi:AcrR family transcriptional regulator
LSRDGILDAARTMIVAEGIDGFSLRRLAARLGVTAPSLYRFFDSKDAIVAAIAEAAFEQLIDAMDRAAAGLDDPIARIKAQSVAYVECAVDNPALFTVMFAYRPPWTDPRMPPSSRSRPRRGSWHRWRSRRRRPEASSASPIPCSPRSPSGRPSTGSRPCSRSGARSTDRSTPRSPRR